jgi:hypothetical protein
MKKNVKSLSLLIFFLFMHSIVFSAAMGAPGRPVEPGSMGMGMGMGGPQVPINNGIIFLLIAGMLYGLKILYDLSDHRKST